MLRILCVCDGTVRVEVKAVNGIAVQASLRVDEEVPGR